MSVGQQCSDMLMTAVRRERMPQTLMLQSHELLLAIA